MKKKILALMLTMILLVFTGCGSRPSSGGLKGEGDKTTSDLEASIHQIVERYSNNETFSGVVFVAQEGEVVMNRAYGKADFEKDLAHQEDMLYQIGSITKGMTGMIIMQLQQEGKLSVEDPLSKYIPSFPHGDEITIHQLLAHTSGLISQPFQENIDINAYNPNSRFETNDEEQEIKLLFTPGSKHSYSNTGYALLGFIIEKVTDMPIEDVMKEYIFNPLGMESTGFYVEGLDDENLATGYMQKGELATEKGWWDVNVGPRGGGGLYSTISDLYKWDQALYTEKLLPQKDIDQLFEMQITTGYQTGYGYGWFISNLRNETIHEHNGISAGYHTFILRRPSGKTTVIIYSNYQQAPLWEMMGFIKGAI